MAQDSFSSFTFFQCLIEKIKSYPIGYKSQARSQRSFINIVFCLTKLGTFLFILPEIISYPISNVYK